MRNQEKHKTLSLRQKMLMVYHEDGILDMVVGVSVLILAGVMAFDQAVFIGFLGIPLIMYIPIKERVSVPRIGRIRFEAEEVTTRRLLFFLFTGIGALLTVLALVRVDHTSGIYAAIQNNMVLIFAFLLGGTLFGAGLFLNNGRFKVYALLSLVLVLGLYALSIRLWPAITALSFLMEAVGIYKLVGFLRSYPNENDE
jgi:hypothetical protein